MVQRKSTRQNTGDKKTQQGKDPAEQTKRKQTQPDSQQPDANNSKRGSTPEESTIHKTPPAKPSTSPPKEQTTVVNQEPVDNGSPPKQRKRSTRSTREQSETKPKTKPKEKRSSTKASAASDKEDDAGKSDEEVTEEQPADDSSKEEIQYTEADLKTEEILPHDVDEEKDLGEKLVTDLESTDGEDVKVVLELEKPEKSEPTGRITDKTQTNVGSESQENLDSKTTPLGSTVESSRASKKSYLNKILTRLGGDKEGIIAFFTIIMAAFVGFSALFTLINDNFCGMSDEPYRQNV